MSLNDVGIALATFKVGDIIIPPVNQTSYKGEFKILDMTIDSDERGVWCKSDKGEVWLIYRGVRATIVNKKAKSNLKKPLVKYLYREKLKDLTDELVSLEYENKKLYAEINSLKEKLNGRQIIT